MMLSSQSKSVGCAITYILLMYLKVQLSQQLLNLFLNIKYIFKATEYIKEFVSHVKMILEQVRKILGYRFASPLFSHLNTHGAGFYWTTGLCKKLYISIVQTRRERKGRKKYAFFYVFDFTIGRLCYIRVQVRTPGWGRPFN